MSFHSRSTIPRICPQFARLLPNVRALLKLPAILKYPTRFALESQGLVPHFQNVSGWHQSNRVLLCTAFIVEKLREILHNFSLFCHTVCCPVNFPSASVSNLNTKIPGRPVCSSPIKSVCSMAPIPY